MSIFLLVIVAISIIFLEARRAITKANNARRERENVERELAARQLRAVPLDHARSWAKLEATGREVFFQKAPYANPLYELTFSGVLRCESGRLSDALYTTDKAGNFSQDCRWIRFNDSPYHKYELVAGDRRDHR